MGKMESSNLVVLANDVSSLSDQGFQKCCALLNGTDGWKKHKDHKKHSLSVSVMKEEPINLIRGVSEIEGFTHQEIMDAFKPENRGKWETEQKESKILEEGDNWAILHNTIKGGFMFSDRDLVIKRTVYKGDTWTMAYLTSVTHDSAPEKSNPVRATTGTNCFYARTISESPKKTLFAMLVQNNRGGIVSNSTVNGKLPDKPEELIEKVTRYLKK